MFGIIILALSIIGAIRVVTLSCRAMARAWRAIGTAMLDRRLAATERYIAIIKARDEARQYARVAVPASHRTSRAARWYINDDAETNALPITRERARA